MLHSVSSSELQLLLSQLHPFIDVYIHGVVESVDYEDPENGDDNESNDEDED